jgi:PKHD-type hydroxylase
MQPVRIANVLSKPEAEAVLAQLTSASWVDGVQTAAGAAKSVKHNHQLARDNPVAQELAEQIQRKLARTEVFQQLAQPKAMTPLLFARYAPGEHYGSHLDSPIMRAPRGVVRTDLAMTLFLAPPDSYEGGELSIGNDHAALRIKGQPGELVVYPASSLHSVEPVTAGVRFVAVAWVQSLIRDAEKRLLLFDLHRTLNTLEGANPESAELGTLRRIHYALLREWVEP